MLLMLFNAADVFLYRDSSIAPLLDMRRRFKSVMDVLDAMIRHGASLSLGRSVELTAQWDGIMAVGPLYPVTLDALADVFFGLVAVLFPLAAWFLGEVVRFSGLFSLVGLWLKVCWAMLLMLSMVLMCSCIGTLPLLPYWL